MEIKQFNLASSPILYGDWEENFRFRFPFTRFLVRKNSPTIK